MGRAIAQMIVVGFRVRPYVTPYRIFIEQSSSDVDFLRVLQFPLSILIPPAAPYSIIINHPSIDST
jgi:hypothetical protein